MFKTLKELGKKVRTELNVYRCVLKDPRTPGLPKALLALAVGYLVLPFDIIPDFLPVIGHLDDMIIVPALIILALRMIPKEVIEDCRAQVQKR